MTREIAVYPPGSTLDRFDWRISIAEVRSSGPFSIFRGIERLMAVLSGRLSFAPAGGARRVLTADAAPVRFCGELAVDAAPLDGPVTDLNVMTRTARCRAELTWHALTGPQPLRLELFRSIILALGPAILRAGGEQLALEALDAAETSGLTECELAPAAQPVGIYVALILPVVSP